MVGKSNSTDLPTDCPTRERHGWSGDAQIFCKTASYLFDYAPFAEKFVRDMCDEQLKNGNFRQISPRGGVDFYMTFMDGSAGWSDAGVFIPYRLYKQYGDRKILERFYPNMRAFAEYKIKTLGKWYPTALPTGVGLKISAIFQTTASPTANGRNPPMSRLLNLRILSTLTRRRRLRT